MRRFASAARQMATLGLLLVSLGILALGAGCGTGGIRGQESSDTREPQGDTDPASARPLVAGTAQQGYVEYVGDVDWYRLEFPQGVDTLRVELSNQALESPVDLSFTVYGEDGLTILGGRYDADGGDGLTQLTLELTLDGPRFCFIAVRDHLGNDADPLNLYFLKATLSSGPGDGNNSPDSAAEIPCGQALEEAIQTRGDVDWFRINIPSGSDVLAISLSMPPGAPDLTLTLYDSMATTAIVSLADSDGFDSATSLARNVLLTEPGPYYVAVRDTLDDDADANLLYNLLLDCRSDPDPNEPNGNYATVEQNRAHATPLSDSTARDGWVAFQGDDDWFRFTMPQAGLLNLTVGTLAGSSPLEILCTVLGPDGRAVKAEFQVAAGEEPANFWARFALPAGIHYLRLKDANDDGADLEHPYSLLAAFEPDPDANEPNGNFPTRQENLNHSSFLTLGGVPGTGYIGSNADQDWFQLFVEYPGVYNVFLSNGQASPVDLTLSVYRPDGENLILVRQDEDGQGEEGPTQIETQLYLFDPGTYYLLVQDLGNNDTDLAVPYELEATSVPLAPGTHEPDEDRLQAQIILPGQTVTGYIEFEGDRDWYGILILGNQNLLVEIWNDAPSPVEFIWFMYPPESTQVYASAGDDTESDANLIHIVTGDDETFWVDAEHPGLYVFKVSDYNRNDWDTAVPYRFRVILWPHVE